MAESDIVLSASGLAKTYVIGFLRKKVRATVDVNLQVRRGEIFGLLGPNGAGKTTTMKIFMDLVRPTRGEARVLGLPPGDLRAKQRMGCLPENPYFYDYLTGRELLFFMGKLFGYPRSETTQRVDRLLGLVEMERHADLALRRYSKGMLQRIGLAQALINDPDLLILDEPLTGLDPLGRKTLREIIAALRKQGKTVVLSSHILSDVELLADRVAIIVRGSTVRTGAMHELLDPRILSTEIIARDHGPALLEALRAQGHDVELVGDTAQIRVGQAAAVNPALDLIRAHGGTVQAVAPRKESLEDIVVQMAAAPEGASEARPR